MRTYKLGLQLHSVREAFKEDPQGTLYRVREMGYTGVEIPMGSITSAGEGLTDRSAAFYKQALRNADLECYGILTSWSDVQPDKIRDTIAFNNALGSGFLVIGSVPARLVSDMDAARAAVAGMCEIHKELSAQGIVTGYHNHDSDFFNVIEGKTFFDHVFENTPEDFVMLLDTGNALAAGYHSVPLLEKYPGRSPYLHIKGYSKAEGYLAYIGRDDFDWRAVLRCAIDTGKAEVFDVEFGQLGEYDPFERAQSAYDTISALFGEMG